MDAIKTEESLSKVAHLDLNGKTSFEDIKTEFINCSKDPLLDSDIETDEKYDDQVETTRETNPGYHMDTFMHVDKIINQGKRKSANGLSARTNINNNSSEDFNGFAEPEIYFPGDEATFYDNEVQRLSNSSAIADVQIFPQCSHMSKMSYHTAAGLHITKAEKKTIGIEGEDGYCEEIKEHCQSEVKNKKIVSISATDESHLSNVEIPPTIHEKRTNLKELRYADKATTKFRKKSISPSVSTYQCQQSWLQNQPHHNSSAGNAKLVVAPKATFLEMNSMLPGATDAILNQSNSNVFATEDVIDSSELSIKGLLLKVLENQAKQASVLDYVVRMQEQIMQKLLTRSTTRTSKKCMDPIDTVEECHRFEENLKNEDFSQEMIKTLESVCSADCGMCGDNVAYSFVDVLFTRRFFTLVTWTGLSRSTETKECFQKFEIIFRFFFDQIKKIDSKYTIKSMKDFFQKLISNSKRRFHQTKMRTSRVKYRKVITTKKRKKSPVIKMDSLTIECANCNSCDN